MSDQTTVTYSTIDANEAVASVAYRFSEVIAIYPITPSSPMGESAESWAAVNRKNLWGTVPSVVEMQSEGGAAGTVHGALQTGALATTFTASQGLLLMIPNMFKIAGELTPAVFHVAARSLAYQALSIFGDHSDVMSARSCGWAMLCGSSTQEAADFAAISHAATLESRIPFINFFDGFRTSHEIGKIADITDDTLNGMIKQEWLDSFRERALTPDAPVLRGTAQNPDVYFQGRETVNRFYEATPAIVQNAMDKFAELTGRSYHLVDYTGAPDAERVIILMGSGAEAVEETVEAMMTRENAKVGVLKVRLFRPFPAAELVKALPATVRKIAVLDRTKEPGSQGEPLHQDIIQALFDAQANGTLPFTNGMPKVVGGRYGLSSKEFTPAMVKGVYDNLALDTPKNHFTIGINDDVLGTSLPYDEDYSTEADDVTRAMFFGLGSDGTVGANKDAIKIIGQHTNLYVQGYFVYDSKKSGSSTISHLRFGPRPIKSTYLITKANFLALHQPSLLDLFDFLKNAANGATFLMNSPHPADKLWDTLPARMQQQILDKNIKLYTIDAFAVARKTGMGGRINMIMQTCFFKLASVIPADEAIGYIKKAIAKTYAKKGQEVVDKNIAAVDATLENLHQVDTTGKTVNGHAIPPAMSPDAPDYVQNVLGKMMCGEGDSIPVSQMPVDGTFPNGTSQYEKRNLALDLPEWDPTLCIQCGKCTAVCPHAVIRSKFFSPDALANAPEGFECLDAKHPDWKGEKFVIQISPNDCTGCTLCADVCPAKSKTDPTHKALTMVPAGKIHDKEEANWNFFLSLPDVDRTKVRTDNIRSMQVLRPLFEFSGACAGCGETPYVKMLSQLFGNRLVVANATGCSSIYGGNLPTTPWSHDSEGRGPAWANSLFEDNAEFGLGMTLAQNAIRGRLEQLTNELVAEEGASEELKAAAEKWVETMADRAENGPAAEAYITALEASSSEKAAEILKDKDYLAKKSMWIFGGDGWAYDIGFGGVDHALASGEDINILVFDTEVYSNTGGQASKSTPVGSVAQFAAAGKSVKKKDLASIMMSYGYVYVAQVAMGADMNQCLKAMHEAESYHGPSIVIAYAPCINHGIKGGMGVSMNEEKKAVAAGYWHTFRFDPRRADNGENPFQLDSKKPSASYRDFIMGEVRYNSLTRAFPQRAEQLFEKAEKYAEEKYEKFAHMASEEE